MFGAMTVGMFRVKLVIALVSPGLSLWHAVCVRFPLASAIQHSAPGQYCLKVMGSAIEPPFSALVLFRRDSIELSITQKQGPVEFGPAQGQF